MKPIDQKNELLLVKKHVARDVTTNWWGKSPSVSFEKKELFSNERTGLKSFEAVGVETKWSCPGHRQFVHSIEVCFDIELARLRDSTGSDAGLGGLVEDEVGTHWVKNKSKGKLYFIENRYTMPNTLN